jgi:hypothetical protein
MSHPQRAYRRSKFGSFTPPDREILGAWHIVDTHLGRKRLQWQSRTGVWQGERREAAGRDGLKAPLGLRRAGVGYAVESFT